MGTIANGKYLLFDLKIWHCQGIGCKAFAFDRSRLKVIQRNVAPCPNLTIEKSQTIDIDKVTSDNN
jgi:hypothetical protein